MESINSQALLPPFVVETCHFVKFLKNWHKSLDSKQQSKQVFTPLYRKNSGVFPKKFDPGGVRGKPIEKHIMNKEYRQNSPMKFIFSNNVETIEKWRVFRKRKAIKTFIEENWRGARVYIAVSF